MSDMTSRVDPTRPIQPIEQPARLAALEAAVRARTALVPGGRHRPRVGSRWPGRRSRRPRRDPVRRAARLACRHRAGARRAAAARDARRPAGGHAPGPLPPVRGQRPGPGHPARPAVPAARGPDRRADQRGRRPRPVIRPGHAHGHARPHQPDRAQPAHRTRMPMRSGHAFRT